MSPPSTILYCLIIQKEQEEIFLIELIKTEKSGNTNNFAWNYKNLMLIKACGYKH